MNDQLDTMAKEHWVETRHMLQSMVVNGGIGIIFWLGLYNIFF